MGWKEARNTLVDIVEATIPQTKMKGAPAKFVHVPNAGGDRRPGTRAFWFEIDSIPGMRGQITPILPRRTRCMVSLVVMYRAMEDMSACYEVMARDYDAILTRLMDSSLWDQSASTIETLSIDSDLIGAAEIEAYDEDRVLRIRFPLEFRTAYVIGSSTRNASIVARPAEPTGRLFRQYYNIVKRALDQQIDADPAAWKALFPDVGFLVLCQDPNDATDLAGTASVLARLEAHGITNFPGFRLNPSGDSDAWFDSGFFDTAATAFTALWAVRANDDARFGFDVEVYGTPDIGQPTTEVLATLGRTRAGLLAASEPLLDAIDIASAAMRAAEGTSDLIPCIHPCVVDDQMVDILIEHADGVGELWTEVTFDAPDNVRTLGDEGAAFASLGMIADVWASRIAYPKCTVRPGYNESLVRRWGGPMAGTPGDDTEIVQALGDGCWLFDITRRDNTVFMTTDWYNGYPTLNSLNDAAYVFNAGELNLGGDVYAYPPGASGSAVLNGFVDGIINNSGQAGWFRTRQGITLPGAPGTLTASTTGLRTSLDIIPWSGAPTWTADVQFYLPSGALGDRFPILSAVQDNAKRFILAYNQTLDRIELVVKTGSTSESVLVVSSSPARNTLIRTQIGQNGTEWRHGTSRTAGVGLGEAMTYLQVGLGWSSMNAGAGVRTMAAGLTWAGPLHFWTRFLSDADRTALTADGGRHPWGFAN